jgi:hypothetical protein
MSHVSWRKSSCSGGNGNCVEVAMIPGAVGVRDSKDPAASPLVFTESDWGVFVREVKKGRHDFQ